MPLLRPRRSGLRRVVAASAATGATVAALLLSGCVGQPDPTPTPTAAPSPSSEPIFASDEEALAAAVQAYEAYSAVSAEVSAQGGEDAERIEPYVSTEFAAVMVSEFATLRKSGLRMEGTISFDTTSLSSWTSQDGIAEVAIYLCRDVSGTRAINASGEDVTPAERVERVPSQAFLVSSKNDPQTLVIDGVDQWSGDSFC